MASNTYREGKPLVSEGCSVQPHQAKEYNEFVKSRGIKGVEFRPDGKCEFRSRRGRKEFMKAMGYHDKDGGYGDG